jgi:tetratricopeptide (TPR) repeat protein
MCLGISIAAGLASGPNRYYESLRILQSGSDLVKPGSPEYAVLKFQIATCHLYLAEDFNGQTTQAGTPGELLFDAIQEFQAAADSCGRTNSPHNWACIQHNLGSALSEQASRTNGIAATLLLVKSFTAYRSALDVHNREQFPESWAMSQNNLGGVFVKLALLSNGLEKVPSLVEAEKIFREVAQANNRKIFPTVWAAAQNNLGATLLLLAQANEKADGGELLKEAVKAHKAALEERTYKQLIPKEWAKCQFNLATVLANQAIFAREVAKNNQEAFELFKEAAAACRAALEIWTSANCPSDHDNASKLLSLVEREQKNTKLP